MGNKKTLIKWDKYDSKILEYFKNEKTCSYKILLEIVKELAEEFKDKRFIENINIAKLKRRVRALRENGKIDGFQKIEKKEVWTKWKKYNPIIIEYFKNEKVCSYNDLLKIIKSIANKTNDINFLKELNITRLKRKVRLLKDNGEIKQIKKIIINKLIWNKEKINFLVKNVNKKDYEQLLDGVKEIAEKEGDLSFLKNVTKDSVISKLSKLSENIEGQELYDIQYLKYKEHGKKQHLYKHIREESKKTAYRENIIRTISEKSDIYKSLEPLKLDLTKIKKSKKEKITLDYVITDIHGNEDIDNKDNIWNMKEVGKDLNKTLIFIKKIVKEKNVEKLNLFFLGDNVGTSIHEEIKLDIEAPRALVLMSSMFVQMVNNLQKEFKDLEISMNFVPGNHAETRKRGEKPNLFGENFDYLTAEETKKMAIFLDKKVEINSPSRFYDYIFDEKTGTGGMHGDRTTKVSKFYPKVNHFHGIFPLKRLYFGHFHGENFFDAEGVEKFFFPCFCRPNSYAMNGYGGIVKRDNQKSLLYKGEEIIQIINFDLDGCEYEINEENGVKVDYSADVGKIFSDFIKRI